MAFGFHGVADNGESPTARIEGAANWAWESGSPHLRSDECWRQFRQNGVDGMLTRHLALTRANAECGRRLSTALQQRMDADSFWRPGLVSLLGRHHCGGGGAVLACRADAAAAAGAAG